jgi:23S rRNA U2552 (ribose-2'-O)-methylase RlmE/FtsJ
MMPVLAWDIQRGEEISGYRFNDKDYLAQALCSPIRDKDQDSGQVIQSDGNRRLSKVGLKAIEFVLAKEWFLRGLDHGLRIFS